MSRAKRLHSSSTAEIGTIALIFRMSAALTSDTPTALILPSSSSFCSNQAKAQGVLRSCCLHWSQSKQVVNMADGSIHAFMALAISSILAERSTPGSCLKMRTLMVSTPKIARASSTRFLEALRVIGDCSYLAHCWGRIDLKRVPKAHDLYDRLYLALQLSNQGQAIRHPVRTYVSLTACVSMESVHSNLFWKERLMT